MSMDSLVRYAQEDYYQISKQPMQWAEIHIHNGEVKLHIGNKKPDGSRDVKLVTRKYYIDTDGTVKFYTLGNG